MKLYDVAQATCGKRGRRELSEEAASARLAPRGLTIVAGYSGASGKATVRCRNGHEWLASMSGVLRHKYPRGCPHCAGVARVPPHEMVTRTLTRGFQIVGNPADGSMETKRTFKCANGHEWVSTLTRVIGKKQSGCPMCRKTTEGDVVERLSARGYVLVGQFNGLMTKTAIRCGEGHEWVANLKNVLGKAASGCPSCYTLAKQDAVERLARRGLTLVSEYVNTRSKGTLRCVDGHEWSTSLYHVLASDPSGCPHCARSGFNPSKPATFYVVKLMSRNGEYAGFGITENLSVRMGRHRHNAAKVGVMLDVVATTFFRNGGDALDLERSVKKTLPLTDSGVEGFRMEATTPDGLPALLAMMREANREAL